MATVEQVTAIHEKATELMDRLTDMTDSAGEWLETMSDSDASDDDKGLASQSLEETLDGLSADLVALTNLVEGM